MEGCFRACGSGLLGLADRFDNLKGMPKDEDIEELRKYFPENNEPEPRKLQLGNLAQTAVLGASSFPPLSCEVGRSAGRLGRGPPGCDRHLREGGLLGASWAAQGAGCGPGFGCQGERERLARGAAPLGACESLRWGARRKNETEPTEPDRPAVSCPGAVQRAPGHLALAPGCGGHGRPRPSTAPQPHSFRSHFKAS